MVSFLLTLLLIGVIVVTGTIVNVRLYSTGHTGKRFGRSRRYKSIARRPMTDVEYYARLDKAHEEGPRYARHGVLILLIPVILIIIVLISLLGGFHS